ncbi:MAG TPA: ADOP family duplicated permease [Vicinamibacteria bacterium]|nr:ADOP family duplicated permease [Vicinamibacteria bacterium]
MLLDARFVLRSLAKSPAFTAAVVLILAMGIGSTVALVSVVQAVLLNPLPYPEPDRLMVLWAEWPERQIVRLSHTGHDFREYQRRSRLFEGIAAIGSLRQNLGGGAEPLQVQVGWVSENFFSVLKVSPILGRDFAPGEPPNSVLLSHALWQTQFGADPGVLGRVVELDQQPFTVVGVLPRGFRLWHAADVGINMNIDLWKPPDPVGNPGRWRAKELDQSTLRILGRLSPSATPRQAQAEMEAISESLRREYPDHQQVGFRIEVSPLHSEVVGRVRNSLLALLGAVLAVLFIACANVAGLLVVRSQQRRSEVGIRAALGGRPGHVLRLLLFESLVLSLLGGVLGIFFGAAGVHFLLSFGSSSLSRVAEVGIGADILAIALAVTLGTTLLTGLLPAVPFASRGATAALRRSTPSRRSRRLTESLVVTEIALSLVLLVGAGLLLRSFVGLRGVRPGFDAKGLLTFSVSLPSKSYPPPAATSEFLERLEHRIRALPGVASAGTVWPLPLEGQKWFGYYRTTEEATAEGTLPVADFRISSPDYLETMGARLLEGRHLRWDDETAVVIDETLRNRCWPGGRALEQKIWVGVDAEPVEMRVVGVAENIRHADLTHDGRETIYLPARVFAWSDFELALVVRADQDPREQAAPIRKTLAELDPRIPMAKVRTAEDYVDDAVAPNRLALVLASIFAATALVMAAAGLYGVVAHGFARRRREVALRMALGAGTSAIGLLVLGSGFKLALAGIAAGTVFAYLLRGALAGLLFGVAPFDPWTYLVSAAILGVAAVAGSFWPMRRALAIDPAATLGGE